MNGGGIIQVRDYTLAGLILAEQISTEQTSLELILGERISSDRPSLFSVVSQEQLLIEGL